MFENTFEENMYGHELYKSSDKDTLKRINPHIISHFLPKNSDKVKLHLPRSRYAYFIQNRERIMDSARVDLSPIEEVDSLETDVVEELDPVAKRFNYRVRRGDNLSSVARKLGLSVFELKRLNLIKGNKLRKGQVLTYFKLAKSKSTYSRSTSKRKNKKNRHSIKRKKKKSKSKKRRKRK